MTCLGEAINGNGNLVMIAGEAGIGKTRLSEELRKAAEMAGCSILVGRCLPGVPRPFLPFEEALKNQKQATILQCIESGESTPNNLPGDAISESSITEQVGQIASYFRGHESAEIRSQNQRIMFSILDRLTAISQRKPTVLVLEDLHWMDSASIQLLIFLARNVGTMRIMILATYRSEEMKIDRATRGTPLLDAMRIMRREGTCQEISLGGLTTPELAGIIRNVSDNGIDERVVDAIAKDASGSPLFVIETFRLLVDSGSLVSMDGIWRLKEGVVLEIPSTIKEVILRRIDRLPKESRRILDFASTIGREFQPPLVAEGLSFDNITVLEILEVLQNDYHLVEEADGNYSFTHDVIRKVTYDEVSSARRKEYHGLIGEILERSPIKDDLYGMLSLHFCEAEVYAKCTDYSILAGEACNNKFAYSEAIPYFARALSSINKDPAKSSGCLRAYEGLADAHHELFHFEESFRRYQLLLEKSSDNTMKARILRKCAECWDMGRLGKGDHSKMKDLIEEANDISDIDPIEKAQILSALSSVALLEGDFVRSERLSNDAIQIFQRNSKFAMLAWELTLSGSLSLDVGDLTLAFEKIQRGKEILKKHPWPWAEMRNSDYSSRILFSLGRYQDALKETNVSFDLSQKLGDSHQCSVSLFFEGLIYEIMGCPELAEDTAARSMEFALGCLDSQLAAMPLSFISHLRTKRGDISGAQECWKAAESFIRKLDPSVKTFLPGLLVSAEAEMMISNDDFAKGIERFEEAVKSLEGVQMGAPFEAVIRTWIAEALLRLGDKQGARVQYESAIHVYERIGNVTEVGRIRSILDKSGI